MRRRATTSASRVSRRWTRRRRARSPPRGATSEDFIMEPDAIDDVKRYVASGGAPSTAIELLSENYRGYAAMTSLAVHWLRVTAPPKRGANTSPIKVNAALEGRGGAGVTTHTPTGGILTSAAGGSARRVGAGVAQRGRARRARR